MANHTPHDDHHAHGGMGGRGITRRMAEQSLHQQDPAPEHAPDTPQFVPLDISLSI